MSKFKQNGAAIIMALLIVALATSMAAFMAQQQSLWQRQVESQLDRAQARRIGMAGVDWARAVLGEDARVNSYDHGKELWALLLPALPVEGGEVVGVIEDRQGLFNLNNLVRGGAASAPDVAQFQRLLALLGLPAELATALTDWMDAGSVAQDPGGAEDVYYLGLARPYRAANRALSELGELTLVRGFDGRTIESLRSFVAVLPVAGVAGVAGVVNVNFASPEVLAAVLPDMSLSDARVLVQQRSGQPFKDVADFEKRVGIKMSDESKSFISVSSQFFLVTGRASVGRAQVTTQALLQRSSGWPSVVWQSVQ